MYQAKRYYKGSVSSVEGATYTILTPSGSKIRNGGPKKPSKRWERRCKRRKTGTQPVSSAPEIAEEVEAEAKAKAEAEAEAALLETHAIRLVMPENMQILGQATRRRRTTPLV